MQAPEAETKAVPSRPSDDAFTDGPKLKLWSSSRTVLGSADQDTLFATCVTINIRGLVAGIYDEKACERISFRDCDASIFGEKTHAQEVQTVHIYSHGYYGKAKGDRAGFVLGLHPNACQGHCKCKRRRQKRRQQMHHQQRS